MKYKFSIIFLKNKSKYNLLAWLIRKAQKTEYNHVEILVKHEMSAFGTCFGAVYPKSRKTNIVKLKQKYEIIKERPIEIKIDQYAALQILNLLCGRRYSFLQLIVLLFKISFNFLTIPASKVKLNLDARLICTELVGIFLERAKEFSFPSAEALTLKDLDKDWT